MSDEIDLEREKTESFELGRHSRLEDIAEDLRERAGKLWSNDNRRDTKKAKAFKKLAKEYEEKYEKERERWENEYKE